MKKLLQWQKRQIQRETAGLALLCHLQHLHSGLKHHTAIDNWGNQIKMEQELWSSQQLIRTETEWYRWHQYSNIQVYYNLRRASSPKKIIHHTIDYLGNGFYGLESYSLIYNQTVQTSNTKHTNATWCRIFRQIRKRDFVTSLVRSKRCHWQTSKFLKLASKNIGSSG